MSVVYIARAQGCAGGGAGVCCAWTASRVSGACATTCTCYASLRGALLGGAVACREMHRGMSCTAVGNNIQSTYDTFVSVRCSCTTCCCTSLVSTWLCVLFAVVLLQHNFLGSIVLGVKCVLSSPSVEQQHTPVGKMIRYCQRR
jgi:hypothetical protein